MAMMNILNDPNMIGRYPSGYKLSPWEMPPLPSTPPIMPINAGYPQTAAPTPPAAPVAATPQQAAPVAGQPQGVNYGSSPAQRLATEQEAQQIAASQALQAADAVNAVDAAGAGGDASNKGGLLKKLMAMFGGGM